MSGKTVSTVSISPRSTAPARSSRLSMPATVSFAMEKSLPGHSSAMKTLLSSL
jgi:hypothetical protein